MKIPHTPLNTRWVPISVMGVHRQKVEKEMARCASKAGWNPKVVTLQGKLVALDYCFGKAGDHKVCVALFQDSPGLDDLPNNAPRAVKFLYRKSVRLAHTRMTDVFPFLEAMNAAERAVERYESAKA